MWATLLWQNKDIVIKSLAVVLIGFIAWWFFWYNPAQIKKLEAERAELLRQVAVGKQAVTLLNDITEGRIRINAKVQSQISSVRAAAVPRSAVLIHGGGVLPAVPAAKPAH